MLPQPESMRQRLRRSTGDLHRRVEAAIALESRLASLDAYRTLLERYLGLYRPVEAALAALDWRLSGIDPLKRRKCAWLEADLRDLGHSSATLARVPPCARIPEIDTAAAGLGCLYVLEGATLGGRVILRRAGRTLGVHPGWGGRFFAGYGARTGPMWRDCVAALNTIEARSPAADAAEAAARSLFLLFEEWIGCAPR